MNRRELLRLTPSVLALAAFRPRVVAEDTGPIPHPDTEACPYYVRRSKPGIDGLGGLGLHPNDIRRIEEGE
jgi:hypothetical protein